VCLPADQCEDGNFVGEIYALHGELVIADHVEFELAENPDCQPDQCLGNQAARIAHLHEAEDAQEHLRLHIFEQPWNKPRIFVRTPRILLLCFEISSPDSFHWSLVSEPLVKPTRKTRSRLMVVKRLVKRLILEICRTNSVEPTAKANVFKFNDEELYILLPSNN